VNGVVNTIYATVGAVTGMYALSKYYLSPMHEELSAARHDFFGHTQEKMDDLNGRLAKLTTVPLATKSIYVKDDDKSDAGSESDASDPTELFHRDIGVQTSPPISRNQSSWSLEEMDHSSSTALLASQEAKIASITSSLRDLKFSNDIAANEERKLAAEIDAFDKYLNELSLSSPYYKYQSAFPTWGSQQPTPPSAQDEIEKFKSEIRSMKGALLSTRNFPRTGTT
jgi:hypothetical protein